MRQNRFGSRWPAGTANQMRVAPTGNVNDRFHYLIADASGFNVIGQITRNGINTRVLFEDFPGIFQAGNTYTIRVVRTSRFATPTFANLQGCQIAFLTVPAQVDLPLTKLTASTCGRTTYAVCQTAVSNNTGINGVNHFNAIPVNNATAYDFQVMDASYGIIGTITTNHLGRVFLGNHPTIFSYGNTYHIRVRAHLGNAVGLYGDTCTIATIQDPSIVSPNPTSLRNSNWSNVMPSTVLTRIDVAGASSYEYQFFTDPSLAPMYLYATATVPASRQLMAGDVVPGLLPSSQYYVTVSANVCGQFSQVVTSTPITTGSILPRLSNTTSQIKAFPNPFNKHATLFLESKNTTKVMVNVYDIMGKLVSSNQMIANNYFEIGEGLSNGHYIVEAIEADGTKHTTKLVKTN